MFDLWDIDSGGSTDTLLKNDEFVPFKIATIDDLNEIESDFKKKKIESTNINRVSVSLNKF